MKFIYAAALVSGVLSVKLDSEYAIWNSAPPPPPIWSVVERGDRSFADPNVEAAMKANPENAGAWPIPKEEPLAPDAPPPAQPFWAK